MTFLNYSLTLQFIVLRIKSSRVHQYLPSTYLLSPPKTIYPHQVHIHTHIYIDTETQIHNHGTHKHMHEHNKETMHAHEYTWTHANIQHTYTDISIDIYRHTRIYTHRHTQIYTCSWIDSHRHIHTDI